MRPYQEILCRRIDADSGLPASDDEARPPVRPRSSGIRTLANSAGIAELRELQRRRTEVRALGLDPDTPQVHVTTAVPDEDSREARDYDPRPPLACEWCSKRLRYPRRGPAPRYCGDACRKRHDRKAAAMAASKAAGIVA